MSSDDENSGNSRDEDVHQDDFEELISMEKLDRNSPEWEREKIPGMTEFISSSNNRSSISPTPPSWARGVTNEDIAAMHKLAELTPTALALDLKKTYDQAYMLGVQEAKEMTRGKYLNIFSQESQKAIQQLQQINAPRPHRKSSTSSE
ncbi:lin-52 [Sergentomyia squamirostris]